MPKPTRLQWEKPVLAPLAPVQVHTERSCWTSTGIYTRSRLGIQPVLPETHSPLAMLICMAAVPRHIQAGLILRSEHSLPGALQGQALNEVASEDCKVLVVGNPCNTNALICMENAPRLQRRNFHALMRLDENRAKCQLGLKAQRPYTHVTNLCVWGNHSTTQVLHVSSQCAPVKTYCNTGHRACMHESVFNILLAVPSSSKRCNLGLCLLRYQTSSMRA